MSGEIPAERFARLHTKQRTELAERRSAEYAEQYRRYQPLSVLAVQAAWLHGFAAGRRRSDEI